MQRRTRPLAPRIDTATWEQHREKICHLYTNHRLSEVMHIMSKDNDFAPTKKQYEAHLLSWNIRKKIKGREWKIILSQIKKREKDGKQTQVVLNNMHLTKERIAREMHRRLPNYSVYPGNLQMSRPLSPVIQMQTPPSMAGYDDGDSYMLDASPIYNPDSVIQDSSVVDASDCENMDWNSLWKVNPESWSFEQWRFLFRLSMDSKQCHLNLSLDQLRMMFDDSEEWQEFIDDGLLESTHEQYPAFSEYLISVGGQTIRQSRMTYRRWHMDSMMNVTLWSLVIIEDLSPLVKTQCISDIGPLFSVPVARLELPLIRWRFNGDNWVRTYDLSS